MQCINCGRDQTEVQDTGMFGWKICRSCVDALEQMESMLAAGVTLEYSDGTGEVIKSSKIPL